MSVWQDVDRLLAEAAAGRRAELELSLLKLDVNSPNRRGKTALHAAAAAGQLAMCEYLIEVGADVNVGLGERDCFTPLHEAAEHGHLQICELLIRKGAQVSGAGGADGVVPLLLAAENGRVDVCQLLLDNGADVNARAKGFSPLHLAVKHGYNDIVELLLKHNASVDVRTWGDLRTPLHFAAERGLLSIVRLLLAAGADVNARDHNEVNALHLAAERGYDAVCAVLVKAGADVQVRTRRRGLGGEMALHLAVEGGHESVVRLLLDAGADPLVKAGVGTHCTPYELAVQYGNSTIASTLRRRIDSKREEDRDLARSVLAERLEEETRKATEAEQASRIRDHPYVPIQGDGADHAEHTPLIGQPKQKHSCCVML